MSCAFGVHELILMGRGLQHQDWEPWVNARMCFMLLQFLLACATLRAARGDSLWQCLHFCLQYLDPFAKLDNKILQFHGPRHSKVKVSCKLDFHHLEHRVLHRRAGSTCQALWCSTAELCAHWAWDIFWYIHMTHIRHSSWNTALHVEIVGFIITFSVCHPEVFWHIYNTHMCQSITQQFISYTLNSI